MEQIAANARFQSLGLPITIEARDTYIAGDTALLIVDWSIDGTGPPRAGNVARFFPRDLGEPGI